MHQGWGRRRNLREASGASLTLSCRGAMGGELQLLQDSWGGGGRDADLAGQQDFPSLEEMPQERR